MLDFVPMPVCRLPILLALIFGGLFSACPLFGSTDTAGSPVRIQGTVTLMDPDRRLVVLQDGTNVNALYLEAGLHFAVGERVELEGRIAPLISACPGFPDDPDGRQVRELFEAPSDWSDYFLSRLRGVLHPPVSGDYTFWIASDDSSELWLSDNEDPARARKIAQVGNGQWTAPRAWTRSTSQQSASIRLEAGGSYYLEALGQDTKSKDCLAVAWQGPGFERTVIDGKFISQKRSPSGDASSQGVIWEYWTNFFSRDFSVLKVTNSSIVKCSAARVLKSERGEWPKALEISPGQEGRTLSNFRLVELEGYAGFISQKDGGWSVEIKRGNSRMVARVSSRSMPRAVIPEGSLVRVRGVFEPAGRADSEMRSGIIWVQDNQGLIWPDTEENWASLQPMPQQQLMALNPGLSAGRIVRAEGRLAAMEGPDLWRVEGKDTFQGYTSADGVNWLPIGPPIEIQMRDSAVAGVAIASSETDQPATATFDRIKGLSGSLSGVDIGQPPDNPKFVGTFRFENDRLTVRGKGHHIWSKLDLCYFVSGPAKGNLELTARLADLNTSDPLAKASLMIRESLAADSPWVGVVMMNSNRVGMNSRWEAAGSTTGGVTVRSPSENWIRLVRRQNSFLVRTHAGSLQAGQLVDVLGEVEWQAGNLILQNARTRAVLKNQEPVSNVASAQPSLLDEVRTVAIAELRSESEKALKVAHLVPLRIRGVATFNTHMDADWFSFVQDETGSVRVRWKGEGLPAAFEVGDAVELTGSARLAGTSFEFDANGVTRVGPGEMPEPERLVSAVPQLSKPNGQWAELEGVVRSVSRNDTLLLQSPAGSFEVRAGTRIAGLTNWMDALIRVRGIFWRSQNPLVLFPSESFVEILEAPPQDPFSIPAFPIGSLQTNEDRARFLRRLKVAGVVTCRRNDFMMVQDETGGIRVEAAAVREVNVGDPVTVAGFPTQRGFELILTDALLNRFANGKPQPPVPVPSHSIVHPQYNGRLVSIDATLLAQQSRGDLQTLDVQSGPRAFQVSLPGKEGKLPALVVGSRLRLTGVAVVDGANIPAADAAARDGLLMGSLELLLRSPHDVVVVQRPPWWNWKYTAATTGLALLGFVGAVAWIRTLRRRVEERTGELREAMARLQKETRISATLAERDRLAGEIHDSVEQGLSGIMIQMEAAAKLVNDPDAVRRYLTMAKNMAGFSRAEVQHAVWDMQSLLLENSDLPTALRRIAQDISADDTPRVHVEISGAAFPMASAVEHHLLRIAQEAMTNAIKHARPGTIFLTLQYEAESVTLTIRDDGKGFVPDDVSTEGEHFGLQGMRNRASRLDAELTVESSPGQGTRIQITLLRIHCGSPNSSAAKNGH